jgi:hypothetical protein
VTEEFSGRLDIVATVSNEFEAEAIVLMLQDGGIPAMAQPTSDSLSRRPPEVHVRVRADDAERAAAMLLARRVESQENEGASDETSHSPRHMPLMARIGYVMALIVVAITIITMVLVLVL